jgi:hypothetical protein
MAPTTYSTVLNDTPELVEEDHWEFMTNVRRDFDSNNPAFVKMGLRARLKDKSAELETLESTAVPATVEDARHHYDGTRPESVSHRHAFD